MSRATSYGATTSSSCTAGLVGSGQFTAILGSNFVSPPTKARLASDPVPRVHAARPVLRKRKVMVASASIAICAGGVWLIQALSRSASLGSGAVLVAVGVG